MNDLTTISGTVADVFAHRFAIDTPDGKILADLGPDAARGIALAAGDRVTIAGERKPSEIKVATIVGPDGRRHEVAWPKKPKHGEHEAADPAVALRAVEAEGFAVRGAPKRKPKHWEIEAVRDGRACEFHVELDGTIRKRKDVAA